MTTDKETSNSITQPQNLAELYSGADLDILFNGGFINFGFWDQEKVITNEKIKESDFIKAGELLYQKVFKHLQPQIEDKILEVGSGYGLGCALLHKLYPIKNIVGLDYFQKHVDISKTKNADIVKLGTVNYLQGQAENIPFPNDCFDKIYTVDAFQHFVAEKAIAEFKRTLTPNGRLVIAAHFANNKEAFLELLSLLPRPVLLPDESSSGAALPDCLKILESYNFKNIRVKALGKHVWAGYDQWIKQNYPESWDRNWLIAYKNELLDYYIITATSTA